VSPATGESFFLEYSHLDRICFEDFLLQISQEFPQYLNVIQMDGAPAHIAQDIEIPDNIVLIFQPAHSPELNPIERLWLDLKLDLRGENFPNLDELRLAISEILEYMTPEWIASLTGYDFILRALSDALIT
jgi:transposase